MNSLNQRRALGGVILLVWLVVYVPGTFWPALFDDADATHAEAAREMQASGDYTTLRVNGIRYLEKPPLPYWLVAASYQLLGVSEFATRLPMVLAVLLSAALSFRWGRRAFGSRVGVYSGLFVGTSVGFYLFTRIFIPDAWLGLFIGASLYFFITALESSEGRGWRWHAGYAAAALAVLTKGLVAIVFAGITAAGYLAITGEWRRWREFRLLSGSVVFLLIAAPWHILAGIRNQGFFWFYFINEHLLRFVGRRYPNDYNKLPALAYWSLHFLWLFPWSLYLPLAVRDLIRRVSAYRKSGVQVRTVADRSWLLCWVWAAVVLFFFAFSTNQEYYTVPAYIPLLILTAAAIQQEAELRPESRWLAIPSFVYCAIGLASSLVLLAGVWESRGRPYVDDIGPLLTERKVGNYTLSMSHFFDLTAESFAALRLPALLAALALSSGPLVALWFRKRKQTAAVALAMAGASVLFLIAAQLALVRFEPYLSSKRLAVAIGREVKPADKVMIYGDQAWGSSLLFYLKRPIDLVSGRTTSMWFGSQFADAPHIFLEPDDLIHQWAQPARIFLFVPAGQRSRADALIPRPRYVFAESSEKVIYTNRLH